ncbi:MAG: PKD domain-containing protein [Saprospiraceae bacterium]
MKPHLSPVLDQHFSVYQVFQLDANLLDAHVKSNASVPAQLKVGDHYWRLSLTLNPIISENYSLRVQTPQGITSTYPKPKIAFKGYELNKGGNVRLTINGEFLYGFVEEGDERFYIEPLWYFEPGAAHDLFVIYPQSAVAPLAADACGVTQEQMEFQHLEESAVKEGEGSADNLECYELELAIASDHLMVDKYGSVDAVESHNIGVINDVSGNYSGQFDHDLSIVIVTQFVSTGNDPWTNSTDAGTLLGSFREWGNDGNFGVPFDNGELWTDRNFNGGTVGIAYLGGICNTTKYHCLQDFTTNSEHLRCMTSHELGHNFTASHDNCPPGDFIMCPFVSNSNEWSDASRGSINNYMQIKINNGCLGSCNPPPPLVADFEWLPNPGCQGEPVAFTDLSSGNITAWSWTFPGGNPAISAQQNPTVTWNTAGARNVVLTITGAGGSNSVTKEVDIKPLPIANFSRTVSGLVVTFTNSSSFATAYEWDFGDGFASNDVDPVHEYSEPGIYTVVLTAFNECGTSTKSTTVNTAPIANFVGSPTTGCTALVVMMENQSSSNAVTFIWSFPGGTPVASNQPNPTVVYNNAGTYSISLTASNGSGSHTFTRTDYIVVKTVPAANFSAAVNGLTATFTNSSLNGPTSFHWNFGDGNSSTLANPVHTYSTGGTYNVVLTATNVCGTSTKSREVVITSTAPPTAAFTAIPSVGCVPLTVNFTNNSTGATSYSWSFPGGNPNTSTLASPTVAYDTAGVYTVTLTATNANGSSTASSTVTVNTLPQTVGFTDTVTHDTIVRFTNTSTGATSYLWTFGDGDSSTVASPIHDYAALDSIYTYQVIMRATNDCGTVTDTQFVSIVTDPRAGFTATPTSGCAPLTVQFNNSSTPNATSFLWRFPGGTPDTSVVKKPIVVYNTPGTYPVTLIAINSSGRDTFIRTNYIVVNTTPTVGFTHTPNGLTIAFTNTSSGGTSYSWAFGDGDNSTDFSPTHTYATDGTYTVTLSATNACGTVTSTKTLNATTAPTAGFTASANLGCAPLSVTFTNTSSSNATTFDWQFPGGNPSSSTDQNPPSVTYDVPGTYTVTLTASNSAGSSTSSQSIIVTGGPAANFSATVSVLTATFVNGSSNGISYSWDFGDGQSSTDANPAHDYAVDGIYTVVLTATNDCGTNTFTQNVVITTEPSAGFSANTTSGCAVLTVNFTDISAGSPVSWEWSFPGGTPSSSTEQNPSVQYFTPGVYDVTLVVTSVGGSTSSYTQEDIITVNGAPSAGFGSSVDGSTATFTNNSSDATSYVWSFGDDSNSTEQNPSHTYTSDGTYNVTLSATNNCGTTIFEQTVTIATPPTAGFTSSDLSGCTPFTVVFTNASSDNATSFAWDFPGGNPATSADSNPTVIWNTAGVYTVTLTASNSTGSSTSTAIVTVNAAPTAGFTYQVGGLTAVFSNTSSNGTSYLWDFGDGSDSSMEANPSHTYAQTGSYTVTLSVTNQCGTITIVQTALIEGAPPVPAINANNTSGCLPFSVQFSDQSAGEPTAWNWTFAGGTPSNSSDQNPSVSYSAPGTYDVTLEVTNIFGTASQVFPAYITVQAAPTAGFTFVANQTTVTFTNNSQNATAYSWNFGDGSLPSNEQNPTHTYAAPGTYTVTLSASNNCGSTIFEQIIVLTSGTGEAAWLEGFRLFPNPNTGIFTVEMSGLPQNEVEFVLFNALGQTIKRETAGFSAGALLRSFDYGDLAAGVYTLRVQADGGQAIFVKMAVGK